MARRHSDTRGPAEKVVVHGEGVRVDHREADLPRAEARSRFGGVDLLAVLSGALAALGTTALLSALVTPVTEMGFNSGSTGGEALGIVGLTIGFVTLALALLLGGWVAGRMARYDGGRNGLLAGVAFVVLTALIGLVAAAADGAGVGLPTWVSAGDLGTGAVLTTLAALAVVLVTSYLGGTFGARWHRKVDDVLVHTRTGALEVDRDKGATS